jgi:hypothetical protein
MPNKDRRMKINLILLLHIAGVLHLGLMCAGLLMPRVVGMHLAALPPFLRQLFWVYQRSQVVWQPAGNASNAQFRFMQFVWAGFTPRSAIHRHAMCQWSVPIHSFQGAFL